MKFLDETGLNFIATKFKELRDSLTNKVDKVTGKDLSTNDYTNEAKAKVDAIPTDPKYTDTVQDLSGYAKKKEIPTKASQLENDISLINSIDFPFFDTLKNPTNVNGDWNATPFSNGVRFYHSKEAKNSPNGDGIYIVFTSFELVDNDNPENISSQFKYVTNENFEPCMVAYHLQSGNIYMRNFTIDKKPKEAQFSPGWFEYGIVPTVCSPWQEITKDFAMKNDITKAISTLTTFKKEIVTSLPSTGKDNVFYLLKDANGKDNNNYLEYLWIDNKWEMIGSTQVDLSGYLKKSDVFDDKTFSGDQEKLRNIPLSASQGILLWDRLDRIAPGGVFDLSRMVTKISIQDREPYPNDELQGLLLSGALDELFLRTTKLNERKADKTEVKTKLSEMTDDATHRLVTDTEKTAWNNKLDSVSGKDVSRSKTKGYSSASAWSDVSSSRDVEDWIGDFDKRTRENKTEVAKKVDSVSGKSLSSNDFTNTLLQKLNSLKEQVVLTQSQYDALSSTDKNDASKIYFIKE